MDHFTTTGAASRRAAGCVVVGVYRKGKLSAAAADIDTASGGVLGKLIKQGDVSAEPGKCTILRGLKGVKAPRIAVAGLGNVGEFGVKTYRKALTAAVASLRGNKVSELVNYLSTEKVKDADTYYLARYAVETVGNSLYLFTQTKSSSPKPALTIRKLGTAISDRSDAADAALGSKHATAIVEGMSLCRDLGNLPANICTPSHLARVAQKLAKNHSSVTTKIINETAMKRLGMHSLLSVTQGTVEPAKLIVMTYTGAGSDKPVVLIGKGVTFDAGGISLKPGLGMDEMKFDMCGAASVIGTMAAVAKLKLAINLTVIVPTVENLPGGKATRPGDIVKSMSGQTIEILNTDAEGRLILCDALTYSKRFKPSLVIDVATLTGACVVALGHHMSAVMSRSDDIAASITGAGVAADDRAWHMPFADEYGQQLKSNFADFANVGGRDGGAITAACFLGKFTKGLNWAHMDIAGTAWHSGTRKGATGRPVPLLTELLLRRADALP